MFLVALLFFSFTQPSFGLQDRDYVSEWGSFGISDPGYFSHPQSVAVGNDGSVYVSDLGNKRIQKFSSTGEFISEWGKSGKQSGEFHYPSGIAVSNDFVFVADRDLNRIQKFSLDGTFVSEWGGKGIHDGQFFFPNGLDVYNEVLFVVDTGNQRIQTFSIDGEFLSSFGTSGLGPGQFLTAVGIDIDDDGNVYVADKGNGKVEKFSIDGEFIKSFPFRSSNYSFSPEAVEVDPSGKMFIVNSGSGRVLHMSQDSDLKLTVFDRMGPFSTSFENVTDIEMGINGELLVVDSVNHVIKSLRTEYYVPPVSVDLDDIPSTNVADMLLDTTKPKIVAPMSLEIDATDLLTVIPLDDATATDESGIRAIINNAPEAFSPGVTNIVWVAFDNAGHVSTASQTVTVNVCGIMPSSYNLIVGTIDDDVIQGTDGDDLIFGLEGNDLISGGSGNDCIFGGSGDDLISGNDGNDTMRGNSGDDILKGNSGDDVLYSHSGFDMFDGGYDLDRCYDLSGSNNSLFLNCE